MSIRLHVIVPCYNPPTGWEQALATHFLDLSQALNELVDDLQLIVVNDGSSRNTSAENFVRLKEILPAARVVDYPVNRGKGFALRMGVASSDADYYLVTDADFPYTIDSMTRVVQTLLQAGGIAAGNRDTAYYDRVPLFRKWLSQLLRWLLRHVLRQPVDDSQCGLKGFDKAGKNLFLTTTIDRFLFDLEFLMLANGKIKVTPVQVELRESVVFSKVGWKVLATEGRNFLWLLFKRLVGK
ncbi:MAG: glycosyltransferase [Saprospiraceae bacterium]|nr:glycosyltransferase [Saprospiraceae bacterium]